MQNVAWPRTIVQNEKGMSMRSKAARSEMPVTMPGRAIGRTRRSEIASRPKNFVRASAAAASVPRSRRQRGREERDADREAERVEDVLPAPGDGEPLQREAGRRKLEAAVLAGEGVEEDEGERQMQKHEPGAGGERAGRGDDRLTASIRRQSASKAPMRFARVRKTPMMTIGTTEKAAASGMFPAVPCWM